MEGEIDVVQVVPPGAVGPLEDVMKQSSERCTIHNWVTCEYMENASITGIYASNAKHTCLWIVNMC